MALPHFINRYLTFSTEPYSSFSTHRHHIIVTEPAMGLFKELHVNCHSNCKYNSLPSLLIGLAGRFLLSLETDVLRHN